MSACFRTDGLKRVGKNVWLMKNDYDKSLSFRVTFESQTTTILSLPGSRDFGLVNPNGPVKAFTTVIDSDFRRFTCRFFGANC